MKKDGKILLIAIFLIILISVLVCNYYNFSFLATMFISVSAVFIILLPFCAPKDSDKPTKQHHSPHPIIRMIEGYNPDKYIEDQPR